MRDRPKDLSAIIMVSSYCEITKVTDLNNFAVSSDGIATALQDSASALMAANNSYEEAVSLIAAANRVVQDPNSVGAALRTISLRLRGTSVDELEEAGEDTTGVVTSKSKLRSKVKTLSGVDILTDTGSYKSTYEILLEISRVWKDMGDVDQAALLEVLAGKNRANTAAAILSNTKDLEEAYKSAMQAEGSAYEENQKYLDSIQGRIDQFTNAWQTAWSNLLDDEIIKAFVSIGTKVIQLASKFGELRSILFVVFSYLNLTKKWNFVETISKALSKVASRFEKLDDVVDNTLDNIQAKSEETAEILENNLNNGPKDAAPNWLSAGNSLTADDLKMPPNAAEEIQKINKASEQGEVALNNLMLSYGNTNKALQAYIASLNGGKASISGFNAFLKANNAALKSTSASAKLLQIAYTGLNIALSMGLSFLIQFAVEGVMKLADYVKNTINPTEQLAENISDLKSEMSDTESEIGSINSQLETCRERMAELLAMPSLSFTEQEELDNLKKEIALLERKLALEEALLERQNAQLIKDTNEYIVEAWDEQGKYNIANSGENIGKIREDAGWTGFWDDSKSTPEILNEAMEIYQTRAEAIDKLENVLANWDDDVVNWQTAPITITELNGLIDDLAGKYIETITDTETAPEQIKEALETARNTNLEVAESIDSVFNDPQYAGLSYGMSDKINTFLDEFYAYRYKWGNILGSNSTPNTIASIFDATSSDGLQDLRAEIVEIANSADTLGNKQQQITQKVNDAVKSQNQEYHRLNKTMEITGVTAAEIADYFTLDGGVSDYSAIDVKMKEVAEAGKKFEDLLKGQDFTIDGVDIGLAELFNEEGKVVQTTLSQIFNDTSSQTRKDITSILEGAYDEINAGTVDIDKLMSKFALKTQQQILDIQNTLLTNVNQELFPGLKEEISGIIDTFDELTAAVGNVVGAMDALDQARAEEAYSGSISLETLQNLMQYTNDYSKIVSVDETGALRLATDAQHILIQEKIEAIKANAEQAYQEALTTYQMAEQANTANEAGDSLYNGYLTVVDQVSGGLAYLGSVAGAVWDAIKGDGWAGWDNVLSNASNARSSAMSSRKDKRETSYIEAKAALELAENNRKIANALTTDNIKARYSSEVASGGTSNKDEAEAKKADDALENIRKKYENKLSQLEAQQTYLENEVARMEAEDEQVGKGVYEEQIRLENEKIKLLEQERAALLAEMKNVAKDSDEWQEFAEQVWSVEHAIQDSTLAIVEFEQKIVDLYTNVFDKIAEAHDNLNSLYSSKQDFINNDIEYAELVGQPVTADMYRDRRTVQEEDYANALAKAENLYSLFQQGLAAGDIKEGTEEYADMALQIADAATEVQTLRNEIIKTNDELAQLYVTAFDKVGEAFDALGNLYSDRTAYAEGYKELQELRGEPISTGNYDYLISNEQDAMADNIAKLAAQEAKFKDALANGIKEGDEDWIKMQEDIRATEKAIQDNQIAIENYNEELKQLYYTAFEKVRDSFGNVTDIYDDQKDFVQSYIDYLEMMGVGVPEEMFNKLNDIELNKQITNRNALADMIKARDELLAQGFTYEDDELVQAEADIRAMELAIWDSEVAMAEVNKRIRELDTEKFEEFMKRVGAVADELERVYDLLSDEDVANEDGSWTAEGIASLGLMYQKMEIAKKQISEYQKEIEELNEAYKSGAMSEQEYNDKLSELKSSQWDAIESYESAKDAIVDLNEARIDEIDKGINKEIEAYEELISLKKKELDAERDLYEFRKDTQKQTKDITTLERRIAAMAGSTDAATIAERTKLEAQLAEAREGLDDTYYSHAMDSQSSALDDEQESYVTSKEDYLELLRESLEDTEQIVAETMAQVLVNADTVLGELNGVSTEYGITLSDQLTYPWINAAAQAEAFKNSAMASEYGFIIQNGIFTGTITDQILAMFGSGSLAANNFQFGIESNIEAIRIAVENAKTPTQSGLIMPYENALDYVQNTFSLNVKDELQSVADKAHALVVDETTDLNAPWKSGKEAANTFGDTANQVLDDVAEKAVEFNPDLSSEANAGKTAWENFATQVETSLGKAIAAANDAATKIGGNMDTIKTKAQAAYNAINSTYGNKNGGLDGADGKETDGIETNPITPKGTPTNSAGITALQNVLNMLFGSNLTPDGVWGKQTATALRNAQKTIRQTFNNDTSIAISGEYNSNAKTALQRYIDYKIAALRQNGNGSSMIGQGIQRYRNIANMLPAPFYAKGTMGTKKDQWAYTDEPWLGDELVMHATPQGTLSFMRAGSTVVPADITENLIEWGKMKPNMDGVANAISGINLMSNVINKPEVNFAIENLLRCDNVSQDTLPEVKKFITEELEKFTRNLNYSLRRVGAK